MATSNARTRAGSLLSALTRRRPKECPMAAPRRSASAPLDPLPGRVPPHPLPRVVWTAPGGLTRHVATDWADCAPTYHVEGRHGRQWEPATGEETIAHWLAHARHHDAAAPPPR